MGNGDNGVRNALNTLLVEGAAQVTLNDGRSISVFVCSGEVLSKLLRFVARVSDDLHLNLSDTKGIEEKLLQQLDNVSFILNLIANYADDIYDLAGCMSSLETAAAVKELPVDDVLKVVINVIGVNRTFFTTRVLPTFKALTAPGVL